MDVSEGACEVVPTPPIKDPTSKPKQFEPAIPSAAFQIYDLATRAIAQLWKPDDSSPSLPSRGEMIAWVKNRLAWANTILARGSFNTRMVYAPDWSDWLDETSGFRVNEHLGYGRTGWAFWLNNREFCNSLMDGIYSSHVYRLFDSHGKRKAWAGAKEAIISANEEAERRRQERVQRTQKD
ncbi:uncharacterized protein Z519_06511 [Cladophialophora bantiana CBS 173.52]|uniref:Uncharacterized protein n=1 Tax=Cladophialophora bantiana (strain ATCC 10958 / CBS 173.52 / CDC B-1940 / NIH 8579) TaxID=1442370 RepID=A0A0D2I744_CLAB1|nr:uncharacterized protein Z519_06511 [Cladophialophora bantiana CBS 173.52]KIW92664.1 hypothetical protein Z519_06511 [Cladophialophora bantiana CBS 173.52]